MKTYTCFIFLLCSLGSFSQFRKIKFHGVELQASQLFANPNETFAPVKSEHPMSLDDAFEITGPNDIIGYCYTVNVGQPKPLVDVVDVDQVTFLDTVTINYYKTKGLDYLDKTFRRRDKSYEAFRSWLKSEKSYPIIKQRLDSIIYMDYYMELQKMVYTTSSIKSISVIKAIKDEAALRLASKLQTSLNVELNANLKADLTKIISNRSTFSANIIRYGYNQDFITVLANALEKRWIKNKKKTNWQSSENCINLDTNLDIELCRFFNNENVCMAAYATLVETEFTSDIDKTTDIVTELATSFQKNLPAAEYNSVKATIDATLTATWKRNVNVQTDQSDGKTWYVMSYGEDQRLEIGKSLEKKKKL